MKLTIIALVFFTTILFSGTALRPNLTSNGQPQERVNQATTQQQQEQETAPFMRAKLAGSQLVLDGLVSENFELVRQGAIRMKQISEAVSWPTSEDAVYDHFGQTFRDQCDELVQLADAGNLQGVHYAYLHLTTNCVSCHNYVRKRFRVEPNEDPKGPIQLIPGYWEGDTFRPDRTEERDQDG